VKRVQKILPTALDGELLKLGAARNAMKRWQDVVGPTLANRSWPDRYDHGVLWVAVEGSAWAQELRLMKPKILDKLSEFAGYRDLFSDIRFGVRRLPRREVEGEAPPEEEIAKGAELSILEIAAKRLSKWQNVTPT
jgi:hypothetical protein